MRLAHAVVMLSYRTHGVDIVATGLRYYAATLANRAGGSCSFSLAGYSASGFRRCCMFPGVGVAGLYLTAVLDALLLQGVRFIGRRPCRRKHGLGWPDLTEVVVGMDEAER